jgi:2'-5' RNA ligase
VLRGDEGVTGIAMLHDEIVAATRGVTVHRSWRDFTPHITLNYGLCKVPEQAIDQIRWPVTEFALVCSVQGQHHHQVLKRWPLCVADRAN